MLIQENLNSLLVVNKLLMLPNGERLSIPPNVSQDTIGVFWDIIKLIGINLLLYFYDILV